MGLSDFFDRMINGPVGNNFENEDEDVRQVRRGLEDTGYLNDDEKEREENGRALGIITRNLDAGIRRFQRDNGLKEDGYLKPGGETESALAKRLNEKREQGVQNLRERLNSSRRREAPAEKTERPNPLRVNEEEVFRQYLLAQAEPDKKKVERSSLRKDERKNQKAKELPSPTTKLVDKEEMQKILDYDPNKGGGDLHSLLKYGFEPDKIARQAEKEAQKLFPDQKGFQDESDAFRHALGSYLMTQNYGPEAAKKILDRHERSPAGGLSPRDTDESLLQDLYNNRVGIEAALNPSNKNGDPVQIIYELYEEGKLQTRPFRLKRKTNK